MDNGYTQCSFELTSGIIKFTEKFHPDIDTPTPTLSLFFSYSKEFSESKSFTNSQAFSYSQSFSNSPLFSYSQTFSNSPIFSYSHIFSYSYGFTHSKYFSFSSDFGKSNTISDQFSLLQNFIQSESFQFTESLTLLHTKSDEFTQSIIFSKSSSESINTNKITVIKSMTYSFVVVRSVTFSFSNYSTQKIYNCINKDGIITVCYTNTQYDTKIPYIIQILSPTMIPVYISLEIHKNKKKISSEQLIGIVCGVTAVFFSILGIVILFIRKKNMIEVSYVSEISTSESETSETQTIEQITNITMPEEINDSADNWL